MAIKEQRDVTKPVANNSYSMKHKKKKKTHNTIWENIYFI